MKVGILYVYSDKNLGDYAIVKTRINLLKESEIYLFSTYNRFQKKFINHSLKFRESGFNIYPNIFGELGLDNKSKIIKNLSKIIHFLWLIPYYIFLRIIIFFKIKSLPFLKKLDNIDEFYFKGGSIFESNGSISQSVSLVRCFLLLSLINKLGKPIYFDPQSFGPFKSRSSSLIFKKIAIIPKLIFCRERISYRYLQIFFKLKNIKLKPDIVFDYKTTIKIKNQYEDAIGLTLVASNLNRGIYMSNIKKLIIFYTNILKISKVKIIRQVDMNDFDDSEEKIETSIIKDKDLCELKFEIVKNLNSLDDAFKVYNSLNFLIGSRLHSTIFSSLCYKPFINIEYQGFKSRGTYELLGLSERVFKIDTLDNIFKKNHTKSLVKLLSSDDLLKSIKSNVKFHS